MMFNGFEVFVAAMIAAVIVSIPQILNQFIDLAGMAINLTAAMSGNESGIGAASMFGLAGHVAADCLGFSVPSDGNTIFLCLSASDGSGVKRYRCYQAELSRCKGKPWRNHRFDNS